MPGEYVYVIYPVKYVRTIMVSWYTEIYDVKALLGIFCV